MKVLIGPNVMGLEKGIPELKRLTPRSSSSTVLIAGRLPQRLPMPMSTWGI